MKTQSRPPSARDFARAARKRPTHAEATLWQALRAHRCGGAHFRRQMPIGPWFADFACISARLVIEVDGRTHDEPERAALDVVKERWLVDHGWRVVRFTDDNVLGCLPLVVARIEATLRGES
eukprot:gene17692-24038_t